VFYLYAVMGTMGGLASAIFVSEAAKDASFTSITDAGYVLPQYSSQFIGVGISAALGIVSGLILSPLICLMNVEVDHNYYHDRAYWIIEQDGISDKEGIQ
jgi:ammonia channel protein AmtB